MHRHITKDDRAVIAALLRKGYRRSEIARVVGMHRSSIGREIVRNSRKGVYRTWHARAQAVGRRRESKRTYRKIENDPALAAWVESRLHPLVSPECVAHEAGIAHETIYAWVARSRPDLYPQLPQRGRKRRRYGSKRAQKQGWTKHVRPIDLRPEAPFSWEGDTLKGKGLARLLTHVESRSLYLVADLLESGSADAVHATAACRPEFSEGTINYDRGSEFALWRMIEEDTGAPVFFAHPHAPWERGANENTNGRLRRVYPKRFDFSTITKAQLQRTVRLMNHTPRKTLSWQTPCAVFGKCCISD
jgi:transposase, IS30 family